MKQKLNIYSISEEVKRQNSARNLAKKQREVEKHGYWKELKDQHHFIKTGEVEDDVIKRHLANRKIVLKSCI